MKSISPDHALTSGCFPGRRIRFREVRGSSHGARDDEAWRKLHALLAAARVANIPSVPSNGWGVTCR